MPRNSNAPRLPASWNEYSVSGIPNSKTRLVCFKTPIKRKRLDPEALIVYLQKQKCKLGLVIDLTDTDKYYDPQEFVALNVVHYKIKCKGMCVPSEDIVEHFQTIITRFLKEHSHDQKYIGIHCLNGVNRTGYLVCRYLMDVLNYDAVKAINTFQHDRGHTIEHAWIRNAILHHKPTGKIPVEDKAKCCIM